MLLRGRGCYNSSLAHLSWALALDFPWAHGFLPPSQLVLQHSTPLGISAPQLGTPGLDTPSWELLLPLSSLSPCGAGAADGEGEA